MGKNSPALSNLNAGELSPDFAGRVDNEKYAVGSSELQNFIPRVQGPARRRPGTRYVTNVKNSANRAWLRRFIFSQGQAYIIEFGPSYCRFYTNHGQVLSGGAPYEIVSPFTSAMLTNADGTCGLVLQQSGDVVYIACGGYWPMTLTRLGPTNWVLAPFSPPDGPFLDENNAASPALYVQAIAGSPYVYDCFATAPTFGPGDVATASTPGRLVRLDAQYFNIPPWTQQVAYTSGQITRANGNTYKALNSATSGAAQPDHTSGVAYDGQGGVQWLYLDSGYGIGAVTTFVSSTHVKLTVSPYAGQTSTGLAGSEFYNFPQNVIGTTGAITGISQANPCVVTCANSFSVGDPVYITGVQGMTQVTEQMYTIIAQDAGTFTIPIDSTGFSAYTSGGTAIRNATLNWQLGAWGMPSGNTTFPGSFPTCNAFYSDRLFWLGGINWWGSVPGLYNSHAEDEFGVVTASSAVAGLVAAEDVDSITWASPLLVLLIGTKGGEFGLAPIVATQPLGPDNVQVTRFSKFRSRSVPPQIIGTSNFYVQLGGKKVLAQDYNFWLQIYESTNQMRLANHIAGYTVTQGIVDSAWHQEPYETYWAVRSDGVLIGYVFDRQDNVTGWHEHEMGATAAGAAVVECVAVIPAPDGTRDEVWMIVNRTLQGVTVRSVEYMEKDFETGDAQNTMCYLDMSGVYNGVPTTTITGLSYLNGETVSVLRDGGGHPPCLVRGGQIQLNFPGSVVQVGLKCPSTLTTMELEGGADVGTAQGKMKRISHCVVRQKNTMGGYIGMEGGPLVLLNPNQPTTTTLASPPPLITGDSERISFPGDYNESCKVTIEQPDPFQMEILAVFPISTVQEPSSA